MNYLDVFLLLVLAWGAWRGYQRGFINLLAGWTSYLVGALVAVLYTRPLAEALDQAFQLRVVWGSWLQARLPLPEQVLGQPLSMVTVQQVETLLEALPVPGLLRQSLLTNLDRYAGTTLGQALAGELVFLLLELVAVLFLFYGSIFILRYLVRWGTAGRSLAPMAIFSRVLGFALGLLGQLFWLSLLVGITRSLLALPAITTAPGFFNLSRQLYSSEVAALLGDFYDWMLGLVQALI
ncbi:MAG: CvpA family protein [Clostridia bacterium]|nr:CvpA family protein [Clostridia bacterium]